MKLVLLKKLKQSQQLKENVAVLPPSIPQSALPPTGLPSGLSITPTTVKVPSSSSSSNNKSQPIQTMHSRHSNSHKPGQGSMSSLLRGVSVLCFVYLDLFHVLLKESQSPPCIFIIYLYGNFSASYYSF